MCIRERWNWIDVSGISYPQTRTITTCDPPCRRPRIVQLNDQYHIPGTPAGAIMAHGNQPRQREERNDLRLEWRMHIPFTKKKKEKKYILVDDRVLAPPIYVPRAPPSPPLTPTTVYRVQPNIVPISPRLPVREHQERRLIAPARERSPDRLTRQREEEARRLAGQRAALDAHIEGLRAEQARRQAERDEARRTRAHDARIREIDEEMARLRAQLETSERRRRAAEGNRIHQIPYQDRRRNEDNIREHQPDFRLPRQEAGGGGVGAGEAGLGGGRHARRRAEDRELRNLERRFEEERRRRKRETLVGDPNAGRRQHNSPRQPWNEFAAGIRINNKNGRARM